MIIHSGLEKFHDVKGLKGHFCLSARDVSLIEELDMENMDGLWLSYSAGSIAGYAKDVMHARGITTVSVYAFAPMRRNADGLKRWRDWLECKDNGIDAIPVFHVNDDPRFLNLYGPRVAVDMGSASHYNIEKTKSLPLIDPIFICGHPFRLDCMSHLAASNAALNMQLDANLHGVETADHAKILFARNVEIMNAYRPPLEKQGLFNA